MIQTEQIPLPRRTPNTGSKLNVYPTRCNPSAYAFGRACHYCHFVRESAHIHHWSRGSLPRYLESLSLSSIRDRGCNRPLITSNSEVAFFRAASESSGHSRFGEIGRSAWPLPTLGAIYVPALGSSTRYERFGGSHAALRDSRVASISLLNSLFTSAASIQKGA